MHRVPRVFAWAGAVAARDSIHLNSHHMRSARSWAYLLVAALAAPVMLAACGDSKTPDSSQGKSGPGAPLKNVTIPKVDQNAPFPAMSAAVFDALSTEVPEMKQRREAVLTAERDAIKAAIDNMRAKSKSPTKAKSSRKKVGATMLGPARFPTLAEAPADIRATPWIGSLDMISSAMAAAPEISGLGNVQQFIIGHQIGSMIGTGISDEVIKAGGSKTIDMPGEKAGTVDASVTVSAQQDGTASGELSTKVNMPQFGLNANSKVHITGDLCPGPDGKVEFTVKFSSDGRAGSGGSVIYDRVLEGKVTAMVGEDANVINSDMDLKQAIRSTAGGRQVYIETSVPAKVTGRSYGSAKWGDRKVVRTSSQAVSADAALSDSELDSAYHLAMGALESAKEFWQSGKCIKIEATSPGNVSPGATSKIPVAVKHRKDGSSVPAKVAVQLTGGASVSPAVIPQAPGDVTHVAVGERGKTMTITLTATSRRGKDVKELTISTGQSFSIEGGADSFHGTGTICDIGKPFTVTGSGVVVKFTPTSDKGGTYDYSGNMSGFAVFGKGTYTVSYQGDTPVGIIATGPGSVKTPMGVQTNTGTEKYTLSPAGSAGCK